MQQSAQIILVVCGVALLVQAAITFRWGPSRALKIYVLGFPLLAVASLPFRVLVLFLTFSREFAMIFLLERDAPEAPLRRGSRRTY